MASATKASSPEAVFRALSDPTRRAILDSLRVGRQPVGVIAGRFPVSRPAISRHLRVLRRSRLVVEERRGRSRLYALNAEPLRDVDRWLEEYRQFWTARLAGLKRFVENPGT